MTITGLGLGQRSEYHLNMKIRAELDGRDFIETEDEKNISFLGCSQFINLVKQMRALHGNNVKTWPVPQGTDHSSLLIKEFILKMNGQWSFPYAHEELCHCRAVSAHKVDQAIIAGAHTPEVVTRLTSASSACGVCRAEVEKIINYRLRKK